MSSFGANSEEAGQPGAARTTGGGAWPGAWRQRGALTKPKPLCRKVHNGAMQHSRRRALQLLAVVGG